MANLKHHQRDSAHDAINTICNEAVNAANHFRLGFEGEANVLLVALIDSLMQTIGHFAPIKQGTLERLCEDIIRAQQRHDLIYIADALEFRLVQLIKNHED